MCSVAFRFLILLVLRLLAAHKHQALTDDFVKAELNRWVLCLHHAEKMEGFGVLRCRKVHNISKGPLSPERRRISTPLRAKLKTRSLVVDRWCGTDHAQKVGHFFSRLSASVNLQLRKNGQISQECGYIVAYNVCVILNRLARGDDRADVLAAIYEGVSMEYIESANEYLMRVVGEVQRNNATRAGAVCRCTARDACHLCDWVPRSVCLLASNAIPRLIIAPCPGRGVTQILSRRTSTISASMLFLL